MHSREEEVTMSDSVMSDSVTLGDDLTVSPIGFGAMALTPVAAAVVSQRRREIFRAMQASLVGTVTIYRADRPRKVV